ncbi:MAG: hypothetical protein WA054_01255 [Candidatus Moraniibacteriota bacterium]
MSGNSSTLTWTTSNASSCFASNGWSGWKTNTGGNETVWPASTTTYALECWNSDGVTSGVASRTVTVTAAVPAPSLTFLVSSPSLSSGQSATLQWNAANAATCTATGDWSGTKATGTQSETQSNITSSKTYYLECWNGASVSTGKKMATVTLLACVPDCSAAKAGAVCAGQPYSDGCSGTCNNAARHCDYNWKEVAP